MASLVWLHSARSLTWLSLWFGEQAGMGSWGHGARRVDRVDAVGDTTGIGAGRASLSYLMRYDRRRRRSQV